ncbi:MAG: hypothetical protein D6797_08450 [Bdellovibrio sp.]|nr:MAG: hypothetical protein D6797_08450 [Bdellovibrio sp.]
MPKITIEHDSTLEPREAFKKVSEFLNTDKDLKKMDPQYSCQFDESQLSGTAKGKMFSADLKIKERPQGGSQVAINIQIPLALAMMKGIIQSTLQKKISKVL